MANVADVVAALRLDVRNYTHDVDDGGDDGDDEDVDVDENVLDVDAVRVVVSYVYSAVVVVPVLSQYQLCLSLFL